MYHLIHIQILSPKVKALLPMHSKQMRTHALAFIPPRIATFIPLVPSSPRVLLHISLIPNAYSCLCIHTATLPLHSYHLTNFIHTTHTREPNHLSGHHDCHHHLRPPCSQKKKSSGRILRRGLLFGLPRPEIPTGEGCVPVSERTGTQTAFFQDFFGFLLKEFLSDFSLRIEMGFQGGDFSDFLKEGK